MVVEVRFKVRVRFDVLRRALRLSTLKSGRLQTAMETVNGKGYDSLILSVQWSRECLASLSCCTSTLADLILSLVEPRPEQR